MISKSVRWDVLRRDKFTCQYCGHKAPFVELQIDHVNPHSNGGSLEYTNLITSCASCNSGKKCKVIDPGLFPILMSEIKKRGGTTELSQEVSILKLYIAYLEKLVKTQKKKIILQNI